MASTLSVWLVPRSDTKEFLQLRDTIFLSAHRYNSPAFTPHITLAAVPRATETDKAKSALEDAAGTIAGEPIYFDSIQEGDTFYQSVFAHVHPTSTECLLDIQRTLYNTLGIEAPTELPHFAHLSLYYGTDSKAKDIITKEASKIDVISKSAKLHFNSLWLVDCSKTVDEWEILLQVDNADGINKQ